MKNTYQKQDQYKVFERHGQLVFALNSEITIPQNAPVRLLSAQLEELEYGKLYKAYSPRGRKSAADPRVLFKVMVHGYLCGIYSSRKLEEACQYRIDFKWLLEDQKAPDHTTLARFRTGRCREAVEDLFYQFVKKLEDMSETDHKTVYIDGTKLESAAGRYTFVWRNPLQKHLAKVKAELGKTNRAEERFRHRFQAGGRTTAYPFCTRKRQTQKSAAARMGRTMDVAGTLERIRAEAGRHG